MFLAQCFSLCRFSSDYVVISWTAKTVENFMPLALVSETEITKAHSQDSSEMMCVNTILLLILAMVWGLRACEFAAINKSDLLTCISDTQKGSIKFSTVSAAQEIGLRSIVILLARVA